jgi:hypothetical protein
VPVESTDPERLPAGALLSSLQEAERQEPVAPRHTDNRNNHRAETEAGLRRIGRPSEDGTL